LRRWWGIWCVSTHDDEEEGQRFVGDEGRNGGNKNNLGGAVENLTGNNISLPPGTYCGGLTIDGRNVRFLPGNHIILDGPLIFRNNAEAIGEDVTFVMNGLSSVLTVQSGADVDITAPLEGSKVGMPGMAFFQDVQTQAGIDGHFPNGENKLSSGGNLNITGTAYFPTQTARIALPLRVAFKANSASDSAVKEVTVMGDHNDRAVIIRDQFLQ